MKNFFRYAFVVLILLSLTACTLSGELDDMTRKLEESGALDGEPVEDVMSGDSALKQAAGTENTDSQLSNGQQSDAADNNPNSKQATHFYEVKNVVRKFAFGKHSPISPFDLLALSEDEVIEKGVLEIPAYSVSVDGKSVKIPFPYVQFDVFPPHQEGGVVCSNDGFFGESARDIEGDLYSQPSKSCGWGGVNFVGALTVDAESLVNWFLAQGEEFGQDFSNLPGLEEIDDPVLFEFDDVYELEPGVEKFDITTDIQEDMIELERIELRDSRNVDIEAKDIDFDPIESKEKNQ